MKIMHVCLAAHYTEGMTYQDNQLPDQNYRDGWDVIVISDCYKYESHKLVKIPEEDKILSSGVRLIRLEYDWIFGEFFSSKVRKVRKLKKIIYQERPDVILFHGVAGYELLTVARYKEENENIKLYVDSHEDRHNSGRNLLSLFFQYKLFNRWVVRKIKKSVDKFLYLSYESRDFLTGVYGLEDWRLEFYPLGGDIISEDEKNKHYKEIRLEYGLAEDDTIVVHSGKFSREKRTKELVEAFLSANCEDIYLFLVGSFPEDLEKELLGLIEGKRNIIFAGWKKSDELIRYLCAADLYFQPGSQSATMQNAICCGTPVALYPFESHKPYVNGNGFFVSDFNDYVGLFKLISKERGLLLDMVSHSYDIARTLLDYRVLAKRLYV